MKLVIITLAHGEKYWWDSIPAALTIQLSLGTSPRFSPSTFPPEITLTKKEVQVDAHQIVYWTYSKFHGKENVPMGEVKAETKRRAGLIYEEVWVKTPCMANDAIVVHESSFPDIVVAEDCRRSRYYVYSGAVDNFANAAYDGKVGNDAFMDFVNEFLSQNIDLNVFKHRYPDIAHYFPKRVI